jgi:hypothetical protein
MARGSTRVYVLRVLCVWIMLGDACATLAVVYLHRLTVPMTVMAWLRLKGVEIMTL